MTLRELINDLEHTDDSLTIYAARAPEWAAGSEVVLHPSNRRAHGCSLPYFLEVSVAKSVLRAWSFARGGRAPNLAQRRKAIVYFAENDAYIPLGQEG